MRVGPSGGAAVVVSNHGGRQLDGVAASLRALPEVVAAVNGRAEVLMDGGVRRGADIVKSICLGARAVLCGAPTPMRWPVAVRLAWRRLWRSCAPTSSARYGCWGALRSPRWIVRT